MMRKCCRHEGGPCFNDIDLAAYVVEYTLGLEDAYCLNNENWCYIDSCFIDVFFVTEICALACCDGSCTWSPTVATSGTCGCANETDPPEEDYCAGYIDYETGIPNYRTVHSRDEAGLDPSTTQDILTLTSRFTSQDPCVTTPSANDDCGSGGTGVVRRRRESLEMNSRDLLIILN